MTLYGLASPEEVKACVSQIVLDHSLSWVVEYWGREPSRLDEHVSRFGRGHGISEALAYRPEVSLAVPDLRGSFRIHLGMTDLQLVFEPGHRRLGTVPNSVDVLLPTISQGFLDQFWCGTSREENWRQLVDGRWEPKVVFQLMAKPLRKLLVGQACVVETGRPDRTHKYSAGALALYRQGIGWGDKRAYWRPCEEADR